METIITALIAAVATIAVAVIEAKASRRRKQEDERHAQLVKLDEERTARDEAMMLGMQSLLRGQIVDFYDKYHNRKSPISVERKRELDEMYAAYHSLGGNGTITQMYEELKNSDIWIVR